MKAPSTLEKDGGAGFRSLCLPIANRPLYRVSYTPNTAPLTQLVECWSYEPKVAGSIPFQSGALAQW